MNADEKLTLLLAVENSGFKIKDALKLLDMSASTYYHWKSNYKKLGHKGLADKKSGPKVQWNSLLEDEVDTVLEIARSKPELTSREISYTITDSEDFSVSESSVYRVLKGEGLIREHEIVSFPAKKEYEYKPSKVNEQWQTDATYLFVEGYGWFYLISVLDDFSRKILAWEICSTNKGEDFVRVIELACLKGKVDPDDMPKLVSDRGPALMSHELNEHLDEVGIYHIYAAPYHPQTNGKIERWHKSLKMNVYVHNYNRLDELKKNVGSFISYYNKRRYHESLGNVTPDDVFYGRRDEIVAARSKKKILTMTKRKEVNQMINYAIKS